MINYFSALEIMDFSVGLFEQLFSSPLAVLPLFDETLKRLLHTLYKASEDSDQLVSQRIFKIFHDPKNFKILHTLILSLKHLNRYFLGAEGKCSCENFEHLWLSRADQEHCATLKRRWKTHLIHWSVVA